MTQVRNNPSQYEELADLSGVWSGIGKQQCIVDGRNIVDTFQIQDIVSRNGFGLPSSSMNGDDSGNALAHSGGIWIRPSYINHSCLCKYLAGRTLRNLVTSPVEGKR